VKTIAFFAALTVFTLGLCALYADETEISDTPPSPPSDQKKTDKIFFTINQGATASWLTRVINQTERSNFVFRDFLPGLYFGAELRNVPYIVPMMRLAAYYPLTATFNLMPQKPVTPLHFAADMVIGLRFEPFNMEYLRINAGPGLHMFFLNADRWNYFNLGAAAVAGIEFPLASRWTLLFDGYASIDNGNLGTNRQMEPFDVVWQYQVNVGFRYSRKKVNDTSLFGLLSGKFKRDQEEEYSNEYLLR
jgi:hypothetical protein